MARLSWPRWVGRIRKQYTCEQSPIIIQNYSMESAPLEVRRNVSWIMSKQPCGKCSVPPDQLEALAADREAWRDVCEVGLQGGLRPQLRPGDRSSSHPSTHAHKRLPLVHAATSVEESVHPFCCGVISAVIGHH